MNMATHPEDMILNAMQDGEDLTAWTEPNNAALADPKVDAAAWRARNRPLPPELAFGVPVLKYAAELVEPTSLVAALVADRRPSLRHCDRCERPILAPSEPEHHLWINCGAQTVVVACCTGCRAHLDFAFRINGAPSLVWR